MASYYGVPYPVEDLPGARLNAEELEALRCIHLWVQAGLRTMAGAGFEATVPACVAPASFQELWWIGRCHDLVCDVMFIVKLYIQHHWEPTRQHHRAAYALLGPAEPCWDGFDAWERRQAPRQGTDRDERGDRIAEEVRSAMQWVQERVRLDNDRWLIHERYPPRGGRRPLMEG